MANLEQCSREISVSVHLTVPGGIPGAAPTCRHMVLIGIQPFAFKKILIVVAALLFFTYAICFADSLFMTSHWKPPTHSPVPSKQGSQSLSESPEAARVAD